MRAKTKNNSTKNINGLKSKITSQQISTFNLLEKVEKQQKILNRKQSINTPLSDTSNVEQDSLEQRISALEEQYSQILERIDKLEQR